MNISSFATQPAADGTAHGSASPQLVKAANAFEANFLGELLKPMREDPLFGNGSGLGGDSLGTDGGSGGSMGTIASLASEALAQAIAKQGGLGIARMVLSQLSPVEKTASQGEAALPGPKCGNCARELTMGAEGATSLDAGSVAMLGEGNLHSAADNDATKYSADKSIRGEPYVRRRSGQAAQDVRAIGLVKK